MVLYEAVIRTGIRVVRFSESWTSLLSRCKSRDPGRPGSGRGTGASQLGEKEG